MLATEIEEGGQSEYYEMLQREAGECEANMEEEWRVTTEVENWRVRHYHHHQGQACLLPYAAAVHPLHPAASVHPLHQMLLQF